MSKITLQSNFATLPARTQKHVTAIIKGVADKTLEAVKASMGEPKSGRIYLVKGEDQRRSGISGRFLRSRSRIHQSSAPGESPAIDSKELVESLQVEVNGLQAEITAGTDYAAKLELDMNRPFLTPATLAMQDELTKEAAEAINQAVRESKV